MLAALQRSCAARHRIQANLPCVKVDTVRLHRDRHRPRPGYDWAPQTCVSVAFSPCESYLAVVVEGELFDPEAETESSPEEGVGLNPDDEAFRVTTYVVLVYSCSEGFQRQARFFTGLRKPLIKWSPTGHLCVAQPLAYFTRDSHVADSQMMPELSVRSAAFTWSPETAAVLQCLDNEANAALRSLAEGCRAHASWSPSCQHLLWFGVHVPRRSYEWEQLPGWVAIADVVTGRLVAQSSYSTVYKWGHEERLSIVWHPSSRGIIFQNDIGVQDLGRFHCVGFATGILPAGLRLHAGGFSSDASHLVAALYSLPSRCTEDFALVECGIDGSQIRLVWAQNLTLPTTSSEELQVVGWALGSLILVIQHRRTDGTFQPLVFEVGGAGVPGIATQRASLQGSAQDISPSGRLYIADRFACVHIADVQSCQLCWISGGPGLQEEQGMHDKLCRMLGRTVFHAWLPSGAGLVCSTYDSHDTEAMATALHLC